MREVVWVTPELPVRPRSGAALRSHRLLAAVSEQASVRVVLVGEGDAEELRVSTGASFVEVFPRPRSKVVKAAIALRRDWPTGTAAAWSVQARTRVWERAAAGAVVVVDHLQMAPYLPAGGHVLNLHNAEAELLAEGPVPAGAVARAAWQWDVRTTTRLQQRALRRAGTVVVVSEHDRQLMKADAVVVANGADPPRETPTMAQEGEVLFIGALKYQPNREAVTWWAGQVWQPGMPRLTVVGTGAEFLAASLRDHPGIELIGAVDDVGPWLARAGLVVVPLRHGGGTRLKVLEALAWGRPVVSTSKGVEGLSVVDGEHVVLADDPGSFRDAVRRLRGDPVAAMLLGSRGREFALDYAWPMLTPVFVDAVLRSDAL